MSPGQVSVITEENQLYGKLIVPTQSDGASFGQLGVGSVSAGVLEEEDYELYISRLHVYEDHLEIGVMITGRGEMNKINAQDGAAPDRNIRIPLDDVTDIREKEIEFYPGFAFETASDLYQVKIAYCRERWLGTHIDNDFDTSPINRAVSVVEKNMGGPSISQECPSCGAKNKESANYCPNCGEELVEQ